MPIVTFPQRMVKIAIKKLGFETALPHACIVWAALDRESIFSYTIPYKDDTFSTLDIMQKIAFSFQ